MCIAFRQDAASMYLLVRKTNAMNGYLNGLTSRK